MTRNVKIALAVVALLVLVGLVIWLAVSISGATARGLVAAAGSGVQQSRDDGPRVIELPPVEISA